MPRGDLKSGKVVDGKVLALLAYLFVLCIIPLLFKKDDDFIIFHGKQGLVLFVCEVGVFILSIPFPWLKDIGIFILGIMSFAGIITVLQGKQTRLPIVADIADKITL